MDMREAIITRINELCSEKNKKVNEFCLNGGLTPSVYYEFVNGRTKLPKVDTIKKLCQGAGITMAEFYDREYFNDYEE
ncbi:MAG: helix-turn-helix transcriptional regulator [Bacillota bacterium]